MELSSSTFKTTNIDHHGLIASVCHDLDLINLVDKRLKPHESRVVTPGQALVAMVLNGLGFTDRRLYLTPQFFANKPVSRLFKDNVQASDFTDNTLGHALDDIADYGESNLFAQLAFEIASKHKLLGSLHHLDSTSMSVQGAYKHSTDDDGYIHITHGHSKDHRPDLKQVILSLVVSGPSSIPIFMEALDGNSSDKASFHETIAKVRAFKDQINLSDESIWVADSALYSKTKLLSNNDYLWISRVPENIKEAKQYMHTRADELTWEVLPNGYKLSAMAATYGGIKQRWVLVYSQQAFERERKSFLKKLEKQEQALQKACWHLSNQHFGCEKDALASLKILRKKHPYFSIHEEIQPVAKHKSSGRPSKQTAPVSTQYKLKLTLKRNEATIQEKIHTKGRFLLATNHFDKEVLPDQRILAEYKRQSSVEGGFRFLKDPFFMVDSVFLKSPKRIQALMMVMTLCLLVYNYAQFMLREKLKQNNQSIPNQKKKPTNTPTMRWVFQLMEGICVVQCYSNTLLLYPEQEQVSNLSALRKQIIDLFGPNARSIYGVNSENLNRGP